MTNGDNSIAKRTGAFPCLACALHQTVLEKITVSIYAFDKDVAWV